MWKTQEIKLQKENGKWSSRPWGMGRYLKQNKNTKRKGKD